MQTTYTLWSPASAGACRPCAHGLASGKGHRERALHPRGAFARPVVDVLVSKLTTSVVRNTSVRSVVEYFSGTLAFVSPEAEVVQGGRVGWHCRDAALEGTSPVRRGRHR